VEPEGEPAAGGVGLAAPPVLASAPTARTPAQASAASRERRIVVNLVRIVIDSAYGVS
jgi:hypothetical protein